MFRVVLIILAIGGGTFYAGYQEYTMSGVSKPEPQTISAKQLEADGPGDNANVVISDFYLLDNFVYEGKDEQNWDKIWIPVVDLNGEYIQVLAAHMDEDGTYTSNPPPPEDLRIILRSSKIKNQNQLMQVHDGDLLAGLVINDIESLGAEEKGILRQSYPNVDLDACWILDHERKPSSPVKTYALMGGGILALLMGLGLGAASLKS